MDVKADWGCGPPMCDKTSHLALLNTVFLTLPGSVLLLELNIPFKNVKILSGRYCVELLVIYSRNL